MERYFAPKGLFFSGKKSVSWLTNLSLGRARVLSYLNWSSTSVQLNRKAAVATLRPVQGGLLAIASRTPLANGKLERDSGLCV